MKVNWTVRPARGTSFRWLAEAYVGGTYYVALGETQWGAKRKLRRKIRKHAHPRVARGEWDL